LSKRLNLNECYDTYNLEFIGKLKREKIKFYKNLISMLRLLVFLMGIQLLWFSTETTISVNDSNFTKNIVFDGIEFFEIIEIHEEFLYRTMFERKSCFFSTPYFVFNEFFFEEPFLLKITLDIPPKPPRILFK